MKLFLSISTVVLLLLMMSCSSITIKHDFDPEYDFGAFKTYRWAAGKEINPQDELQKLPLVAKRVMVAVDKVLAKKGLIKVDGDKFDVVVMAHAGSKEKMQVHQTGGGYYGGYGGWYDPWWGPHGGTTSVSYYEEATLVIDIVAWETKELAWRGLATGTVRENQDGDEQQKRLDGIAEKIFADYPPK